MSVKQTAEGLVLPGPIAAYFAADTIGAAEVVHCFTETAAVIDERQAHVGRDAIRRWKEGKATEYSYVSEPFAIHEDDGKIVVSSHLTGNFPGNKIDLRYIFKLEGAQIAQLEIVV